MTLPKPYYHDEKAGITIYHGDCLSIVPSLPEIDFVYADPPYGVDKAEWDKKYFTGWEKMCVNKSKHGLVCNTGTKSIAVAINAFGDSYIDLFYAWNTNGMTRSSIGFMNVMVCIVAGKKLGWDKIFVGLKFKISHERIILLQNQSS